MIAFDIRKGNNDNKNLKPDTLQEIEAHFNKGVRINTTDFTFNTDEA